MLHGAAVAFHLDGAGRDRRFGQRRHHGPNAEADHEHQEHREAEQRRPAGPRRRCVEQGVRREGGQGGAEGQDAELHGRIEELEQVKWAILEPGGSLEP